MRLRDMAALWMVLLWMWICSPTLTTALNCSAMPISLPIANSSFNDTNPSFVRRGVPVSIGTPPQNVSMNIRANYNNTYFEEGPMTSTNCKVGKDWTYSRCIANKGGVYNRYTSQTWLPQSKESFSGAPNDHFPGSTAGNDASYIVGEETFTSGGLSLTEFPVAVLNDFDGRFTDRGSLGLSRNSSLLNELVNREKISSHTWSLDVGWTGNPAEDPNTWVDGRLTLGGYDESRFVGKLYQQPFAVQPNGMLDVSCALKVTIESITLTNSSGSVISLLGTELSDAKRACITPEYPLITIPYDMFTVFNRVMGGKYSEAKRTIGSYYFRGYIDKAPFYDGELTIRLDNGFTATIPNHEIVKPYRDINTKGESIILNGKTERALLLNALLPPNEKDILLLGMPFLSSTYLMVDNDRLQFSLARTSRSTNLGKSRIKRRQVKEKLVSIQHPDCPTVGAGSNPFPTASIGADGASSRSNSSAAAATHIGPIAGGIGGGIAMLLVAGVAVFCLRKRTEAHIITIPLPISSDQAKSSESGGQQQRYYHYSSVGVSGANPPEYPVYEVDSRSMVQPIQELEACVPRR